MKNLHLSLLTRSNFEHSELARRVLELIIGAHPDLRPRRYGRYEPLPYLFEDDTGISDLLKVWVSPVFWNQGHRTDGSFFFGSKDLHSSIYISCTASRVPPAKLAEVLEALAELLVPDFASIYYQAETKEIYLERYHAVYPFCIGPTSHDLRKSLPDLPWYSIFGPAYISFFGVEKLTSCPGYSSMALGEQLWALKLVEDPQSAKKSPAKYSSIRDSAKKHLGTDCFLDLESPQAQQITPDFKFQPLGG